MAITMTTYPSIPERPVTRAEIERLTSIIAQLNDELDAGADREDALRHELDLRAAPTATAETMARASEDDAGLVVDWAMLEQSGRADGE